MKKQQLPDEVLKHHTAVLGKTGSGKTSTAKLMVERIAAQRGRVCVLDPIKSDWWGLTSSADGKKPGLPFQILGGPRGHVPLPESAGKAIGEIVASSALPLSIIDMADFGPGGLQRFFTEFAPALLKNMTGVVTLVIEEAHEFAPKERSGIGAENLAIHWAKKLATAGRSKGIRLILCTQRTQALHNALLGSCETMIAHRFTTPADQAPIKEWLKANTDKVTLEKVSGSLSSLKTGTAWVCSGEANIFEVVEFPRISTFDNSKTPTNDAAAVKVTTAAVDQDKLRAILGDAVKEAEANDPNLLKAKIRELEAKLAKVPAATPAPEIDKASLDAAHGLGFLEGESKERERGAPVFKSIERALDEITKQVEHAKTTILAQSYAPRGEMPSSWATVRARLQAKAEVFKPAPVARAKPSKIIDGLNDAIAYAGGDKSRGKAFTIMVPAKPQAMESGIPASLQPALDAVAWWEFIGISPVARDRVAVVAGRQPGGSTARADFANLLRLGLVLSSGPGLIELTDAGRAQAKRPVGGSISDLRQMALNLLGDREKRVFEVVYEAYPNAITRHAVATECGVEPGGSTARAHFAGVIKFGLIEASGAGAVRAADWLFQDGR